MEYIYIGDQNPIIFVFNALKKGCISAKCNFKIYISIKYGMYQVLTWARESMPQKEVLHERHLFAAEGIGIII